MIFLGFFLFCMKFSELYEKIHNMPDFGRVSHEKVVNFKSDIHYYSVYLTLALFDIMLSILNI